MSTLGRRRAGGRRALGAKRPPMPMTSTPPAPACGEAGLTAIPSEQRTRGRHELPLDGLHWTAWLHKLSTLSASLQARQSLQSARASLAAQSAHAWVSKNLAPLQLVGFPDGSRRPGELTTHVTFAWPRIASGHGTCAPACLQLHSLCLKTESSQAQRSGASLRARSDRGEPSSHAASGTTKPSISGGVLPPRTVVWNV